MDLFASLNLDLDLVMEGNFKITGKEFSLQSGRLAIVNN